MVLSSVVAAITSLVGLFEVSITLSVDGVNIAVCYVALRSKMRLCYETFPLDLLLLPQLTDVLALPGIHPLLHLPNVLKHLAS